MTALIGILLGMGVMIMAILQVKADYRAFLNVPSFFIVLGGIIASTMTAFRAHDLFNSLWGFLVVFFRWHTNVIKEIELVSQLSGRFSQDGMGGLEEELKRVEPSLLKDGVQLFLNGYKWEEVEHILEASIALRYEREQTQVKIFRNMGKAAPAFGMVGTVVGLVFMLNNLKDRPDDIGPHLAIALTATLYGLFFANVVFHPMAEKISVVAESNVSLGRMYLEAVKLIMEKRHPIYVKDRLAGYVTPRDRRKLYVATPARPGASAPSEATTTPS